MTSPYSYARGVHNTRVTVEEEATLKDLRTRFRKPVRLELDVDTYHESTKAARGDVKKSLPYFVGGVIEGKRHDSNVKARTLLTLDIEAPGERRNETDTQRSKREQVGQPPPPQDVHDMLDKLGMEGWVYTSISHTADAPRYRVVLPLDKPLENGLLNEEVMQASTQDAADKLGIKPWCTPESWVLSQPMYLPAVLEGGDYWEGYVPGRRWRVVKQAPAATVPATVADIPDGPVDPVLQALKRAGLYLNEDARHKGKHYITCPFVDQHGSQNETQTVYYEAHHDGNPRPAVKCFDTEPDFDGKPHLTYKTLVNALREGGWVRSEDENADTSTALEDYESFERKASIGQYLEAVPAVREFAWDRFAPVGKVTVLAGPGGVSKSMMMLHLLVHGALGMPWGGFNVNGPLRGLYASYEDDTLELHKRVHTLAGALREADDGMGEMLYDIDGALRRNLYLFAADEDALKWLLMVKPDARSGAERTARVEWLVGFIRHARLKVLVLDPVVYTHTLEENDSGDMALYMQTLTYIAKAGGCAVVILHHMHKSAQWASLDDINQGSLRGASAFADNSRSVGVLVSVPAPELARYGLQGAERSQYAVFKHVKHNYSAPMPPMVFERKGALLTPRPDIVPLGAEEAKEAALDAKEQAQARKVEQRCLILLGWLQDNPGANTNLIRSGTGIRFNLVKTVLETALNEGWITTTKGPNNATLYAVTASGAEWFAAKNTDK